MADPPLPHRHPRSRPRRPALGWPRPSGPTSCPALGGTTTCRWTTSATSPVHWREACDWRAHEARLNGSRSSPPHRRPGRALPARPLTAPRARGRCWSPTGGRAQSPASRASSSRSPTRPAARRLRRGHPSVPGFGFSGPTTSTCLNPRLPHRVARAERRAAGVVRRRRPRREPAASSGAPSGRTTPCTGRSSTAAATSGPCESARRRRPRVLPVAAPSAGAGTG